MKLYFNSESSSPLEIIKKVKELDFRPVAGDYDFVADYDGATDYAELVGALHRALSGTHTTYRLITRPD